MSKINYVVKVGKKYSNIPLPLFSSSLPSPSHLNILICHHKFHDAYEGIISKKDKYVYLVCVPWQVHKVSQPKWSFVHCVYGEWLSVCMLLLVGSVIIYLIERRRRRCHQIFDLFSTPFLPPLFFATTFSPTILLMHHFPPFTFKPLFMLWRFSLFFLFLFHHSHTQSS